MPPIAPFATQAKLHTFQTLQKFHSQQKHFVPSKRFKCAICLQLPHLQHKLSYTRSKPCKFFTPSKNTLILPNVSNV